MGLTVPSTIEHVIPANRFDIEIKSPDGKELFASSDESPRGGRILENVNLSNYTGNIPISLHNIVPDSEVIDLVKKQLEFASNKTDVTDSVEIQAEIVKS